MAQFFIPSSSPSSPLPLLKHIEQMATPLPWERGGKGEGEGDTNTQALSLYPIRCLFLLLYGKEGLPQRGVFGLGNSPVYYSLE